MYMPDIWHFWSYARYMPGICLTYAWHNRHLALIHMPGICHTDWSIYLAYDNNTGRPLGPILADPSMCSRRNCRRSLRCQQRSYRFRRPRVRLTCPLAATFGGCRLAEASERAITGKRVRSILRLCENQDRHWCQHQMLINSYPPITIQIDIKERWYINFCKQTLSVISNRSIYIKSSTEMKRHENSKNIIFLMDQKFRNINKHDDRNKLGIVVLCKSIISN